MEINFKLVLKYFVFFKKKEDLDWPYKYWLQVWGTYACKLVVNSEST